jgi:hypothetical protein
MVNSFRFFLGIVFVFGFCAILNAQKLNQNGFRIKYVEIHKETMNNCGESYTVYKGTIKVNSKTGLKGIFSFYFAEMGNNLSLFTVKGNDNKILSPTIKFDQLKRDLSINNGNPNEIKIFVDDEKTDQQVILEAMLLWLKNKGTESIDK